MKSEVTVTISPVWLYEDADLSECRICKDVIYYKMWRLWIEVGSFPMQDTKIKICDSCKDYTREQI